MKPNILDVYPQSATLSTQTSNSVGHDPVSPVSFTPIGNNLMLITIFTQAQPEQRILFHVSVPGAMCLCSRREVEGG